MVALIKLHEPLVVALIKCRELLRAQNVDGCLSLPLSSESVSPDSAVVVFHCVCVCVCEREFIASKLS